MLAYVDRALVAPARSMNPSLARELGFLCSANSFCLILLRRSQQIGAAEFHSRKKLGLLLDGNIIRPRVSSLDIKRSQRHGLVIGRGQRTGKSCRSDRKKPHDLL